MGGRQTSASCDCTCVVLTKLRGCVKCRMIGKFCAYTFKGTLLGHFMYTWQSRWAQFKVRQFTSLSSLGKVRQSTSLNNLEKVSYMKGILGFQTLPQLSCLELNDKTLHDVGGRIRPKFRILLDQKGLIWRAHCNILEQQMFWQTTKAHSKRTWFGQLPKICRIARIRDESARYEEWSWDRASCERNLQPLVYALSSRAMHAKDSTRALFRL